MFNKRAKIKKSEELKTFYQQKMFIFDIPIFEIQERVLPESRTTLKY